MEFVAALDIGTLMAIAQEKDTKEAVQQLEDELEINVSQKTDKERRNKLAAIWRTLQSAWEEKQREVQRTELDPTPRGRSAGGSLRCQGS